MIERVTLGQLRVFVAAVDEGSFSAAGRKLGKPQSVVTQTIANLERQLGLKLFDRTARCEVGSKRCTFDQASAPMTYAQRHPQTHRPLYHQQIQRRWPGRGRRGPDTVT